ncbi:MAG: recJ, partial [Chloroflexi bacterium]|nr:recJ [Chloroflexota bacterium]
DGILKLESVGSRLADLLDRLEPTGAGNPRPTFVSRGLLVSSAQQTAGGHLRMELVQGTAIQRGIAFRPEFQIPARGTRVDVLYEVERSVWNGEERVELIVRQMRPTTLTVAPGSSDSRSVTHPL